MAERFLISKNAQKPIPDGVTTKDFDREDLIKKYIMYGLQPTHVEGDDKAIWVHFLPDDIKEFEDMYFSNQTIVITFQMFEYANGWWRDIIVKWKSEQRYLANLARNKVALNAR